MTFYEKELQRIRGIIYDNQHQIDTVIKIRNHIENHYASNLNLDQLSHKFLISKFHMLRIFKRYYGITPGQYLMDTRISKSREKLSTGFSVTDTCFEVGFESLASFSKLFKTKTGVSPIKFQKSNIR